MNIENFDQFRLRMEQQLDKLKQASRPSRFIPPANFALVDIYPHEEIAHGAIRGEVLDISPAGMKIAIHAHLCVEIDQSWTLILGQAESEQYQLAGRIRWVERNRLITVVGLNLY